MGSGEQSHFLSTDAACSPVHRYFLTMERLGPQVADILVREFAIPADYANMSHLRSSPEFPYRTTCWIRIQVDNDRSRAEVGLRALPDGTIILAEMAGTPMTANERAAFERAVAAIGALQGDYSTPLAKALIAPGHRSRLSPLAARQGTCLAIT